MTYKTFFKSVYVLKADPEDYKKLEGKRVGKVFEYEAPADSILLHLGSTFLHVAVGREITAPVLKNLINVALTHKKPVKLEFCESLKNLQAVDQIILRINGFLGFKDILI
jgi:hypothetical protein